MAGVELRFEATTIGGRFTPAENRRFGRAVENLQNADLTELWIHVGQWLIKETSLVQGNEQHPHHDTFVGDRLRCQQQILLVQTYLRTHKCVRFCTFDQVQSGKGDWYLGIELNSRATFWNYRHTSGKCRLLRQAGVDGFHENVVIAEERIDSLWRRCERVDLFLQSSDSAVGIADKCRVESGAGLFGVAGIAAGDELPPDERSRTDDAHNRECDGDKSMIPETVGG